MIRRVDTVNQRVAGKTTTHDLHEILLWVSVIHRERKMFHRKVSKHSFTNTQAIPKSPYLGCQHTEANSAAKKASTKEDMIPKIGYMTSPRVV